MKTLYVFDNVGTLYDDAGTQKQFMEIFYRYASGLLATSQENVATIIHSLKTKHGTEFSLIALMREFNINYEDMVNNTYLQVTLGECGIVSPDIVRYQTLSQIIGPKVVFTNNPSAFAKKVLSYTGLTELFSDFIGMEELEFSGKPSIRSFEIIENHHRGFDQIIFVDDLVKNLDVAKQRGWKTVWYNPIGVSTELEHRHLFISSFGELLKVT